MGVYLTGGYVMWDVVVALDAVAVLGSGAFAVVFMVALAAGALWERFKGGR